MEHAPASERSPKARILVVEDDRASRSAMMALLRLCGFEALPATTVAEGLDMLAWQPTCLILDLMLPDGNGAEILAYIRSQRLPIQVVVTTGAIEWERMLRGASTGPDAVFQKPLNFKQLITWLHEHCRTGGHAQDA